MQTSIFDAASDTVESRAQVRASVERLVTIPVSEECLYGAEAPT